MEVVFQFRELNSTVISELVLLAPVELDIIDGPYTFFSGPIVPEGLCHILILKSEIEDFCDSVLLNLTSEILSGEDQTERDELFLVTPEVLKKGISVIRKQFSAITKETNSETKVIYSDFSRKK